MEIPDEIRIQAIDEAIQTQAAALLLRSYLIHEITRDDFAADMQELVDDKIAWLMSEEKMRSDREEQEGDDRREAV